MLSKENINVPEVSESLLHGAGYKPLTGGTSYFTTMKMIQDLKQQFPHPDSKQKRHLAIYECPFCGKPFKTWVESVKRGSTKSCGCNRKGVNSTHKLSKTRLYRIWAGMKSRCNYTHSFSYKDYGGRGIFVCNDWESNFELFYNWAINNGYKRGLQIDRRDNNREYSPDNCRWVSAAENAQNTRKIRKTNTSGTRGVYYRESRRKWVSRICYQRTSYNLGSFKSKKEAINAYNNFVINNRTSHPLIINT